MARTHRYKKKAVLAAVRGSGGIVAAVARRLGCDWNTARDNIARFPDAKALFGCEGEEMLDLAEGAVHKAIKSEDMVTVRWYLATKGRRRGYGDEPAREEEAGGNELRVVIDGDDT